MHWLHKLNLLMRRYRWYLRLPSYLAYRRWLSKQTSQLPADKPLVVMDFADSRIDGPQGRRVYALFIFFVRCGYHVAFVRHYLFLVNITSKLKALILREPFSVIRSSEAPTQPFILVTDHRSKLGEQASRTIHIDYRPGHTPGDSTVPMPFSLFPRIYADGQDQQLQSFREQSRHWGVFFGGDADPAKYSKSSIKSVYGKTSRPQMLDALRDQLPAALAEFPESQPAFDALLEASTDGLVVMNTRACSVAAKDWLRTLARARFFLACPGYRYPMSHNTIEAMAVGTVPIIEYPEQFFPALRDGVNCLSFSGAEHLVAVTRRAIDMPAEQWQRMSQAAADYYDAHLAPQPTIDALTQAMPDADNTVTLRYLPFFKRGGGFA